MVYKEPVSIVSSQAHRQQEHQILNLEAGTFLVVDSSIRNSETIIDADIRPFRIGVNREAVTMLLTLSASLSTTPSSPGKNDYLSVLKKHETATLDWLERQNLVENVEGDASIDYSRIIRHLKMVRGCTCIDVDEAHVGLFFAVSSIITEPASSRTDQSSADSAEEKSHAACSIILRSACG